MPARMPPRKAAPGGQPAGARSAAAGGGAAPNLRFHTERVLNGVDAVRQRLPDCFPEDVVNEWADWGASTPNSVEEIAAADRKHGCLKMPMKCGMMPTQQAPEVAPRVQRELITYQNASGSGLTRSSRDLDAAQSKPLLEADISVGYTIAIKRSDSVASERPGYGTPFYLGDVISVELASAAAEPRRVESVVVHYRMPRRKRAWVDELTRPWKRVCWAGVGVTSDEQHEWDPACEHRKACCDFACRNNSSTSRMTQVISANNVFATKIHFNQSQGLTVESRERIARSGPRDGAWGHALGVEQIKEKKVAKEAAGVRKKSRH